MNCICLACLLGEILHLPICLIGYSSVSLILYREGKRTIGHIQFADACDFRGGLGRDWQWQRHWALSTSKNGVAIIRWLWGCIRRLPIRMSGMGASGFVLVQRCFVVVGRLVASIWRHIKMILYQQTNHSIQYTGLSFPLKDTATTCMDFKATFDDSSCLRPTMVKFREGESRTVPVRAGRSRHRQSVLHGYRVSFFKRWRVE